MIITTDRAATSTALFDGCRLDDAGVTMTIHRAIELGLIPDSHNTISGIVFDLAVIAGILFVVIRVGVWLEDKILHNRNRNNYKTGE